MKTFKDLQEYLSKNNLGQLSICMLGLQKRNFRIDVILGPGMWNYHCSWSKNTRGLGYFHYEDWIYTEEEMVKIIYNDLPIIK